ncbi:hypothetical protein PGT21_017832 [Puccinia graminis f. sp. tritici]|uniref:Uncharacterized protein n=1 Tax=Puccinia graminis f. sp. tritici TaxID=56615 RepID=A0A5B0RMW1_PUCGR|nr:hypothetical protein PGT21_017832 [Puccinia graminis f. sp. tritici]KAA1126927.1 hypothetical protein PGTUg99_032018 [Puccinia graminis f. sp. tritici]
MFCIYTTGRYFLFDPVGLTAQSQTGWHQPVCFESYSAGGGWWRSGQPHAGPTLPIQPPGQLCRHAMSAELAYLPHWTGWPGHTQPTQPGSHRPANGGGWVGSCHASPMMTNDHIVCSPPTFLTAAATIKIWPVWKVGRALGDFLHFSAPQHVLLRHLPSPSPSSSASKSTPTQFPTLRSLNISRAVIRCPPLGLRMSPLRRLSVQILLRPLVSRSPTAASASVGRDPRCPPVPGFPAVSLLEPCAFGLLFSAFPRLEKLDFPLMHRSFPQPACVATPDAGKQLTAAPTQSSTPNAGQQLIATPKRSSTPDAGQQLTAAPKQASTPESDNGHRVVSTSAEQLLLVAAEQPAECRAARKSSENSLGSISVPADYLSLKDLKNVARAGASSGSK